MNPSTEKMLMQEVPRIRFMLEVIAKSQGVNMVPDMPVTMLDIPQHPGEDIHIPRLKPGVTATKNGRYMRDGKFISKEEAYE